MSASPDRSVAHRDDPELLLGVLRPFTESVIVGFEPSEEHLDLHVAPIPPDPRAGAAGLFGIEAPPEWSAVGAAFPGRARDLHTGDVLHDAATAAVVVTRGGDMASNLRTDGVHPMMPLELGDDGYGNATGLVVDALHRILGLPCPGVPPAPLELALSMWSHELLGILVEAGTVSWAQAVAAHPGDPGGGSIGPSDEMLVEALIRLAEGFSWEHMHARAVAGRDPAGDLSTHEAAWMDTTLFSRWVLSSIASPHAIEGLLWSRGSGETAERFTRVMHAVHRLILDPSPG